MTLPAEIDFVANPAASPARMNVATGHINGRLQALEVPAKSLDTVLAQLQAIGLQRIADALKPVYDQLVSLAQLGAIFTTTSASTVTVQLGSATFVVDEDDWSRFAAAGYIIAQAVDDPETLLFGPLQSYDRSTGALKIGVQQFVGPAGAAHASWLISAGATPNFVATAHGVGAYTQAEVDAQLASLTAHEVGAYTQAEVDAQVASLTAALGNRLRTDIDAGLSATQRAWGKRNLRVEQPSFTFTANGVLTAQHIGAAIGCDPGCTALTLPLLSGVESGGKILMHAYTQAVTVSVDAGEALGLFISGAANVKSIVVPARWSLEVVSRGQVWMPRLIPWGYDVPNASLALTFTAAQKRTLKQQIGAGGVVNAISGTSTLTAAAINSVQPLSGDAYAVTLPAAASWAIGDSIEFPNTGNGTITIARNAADANTIAYGLGLTASNVPVGPGQNVKLTYDGTNFIASGRAVAPERTVSVDAVPAWTAAQKSRAARSIASTVVAVGADRAITVDDHEVLLIASGGAWNQALPAAATAGAGMTVHLRNNDPYFSTAIVPSGTDKVDGVTGTFLLHPKQECELRCDGTGWWTRGLRRRVTLLSGEQAGASANLLFDVPVNAKKIRIDLANGYTNGNNRSLVLLVAKTYNTLITTANTYIQQLFYASGGSNSIAATGQTTGPAYNASVAVNKNQNQAIQGYYDVFPGVTGAQGPTFQSQFSGYSVGLSQQQIVIGYGTCFDQTLFRARQLCIVDSALDGTLWWGSYSVEAYY